MSKWGYHKDGYYYHPDGRISPMFSLLDNELYMFDTSLLMYMYEVEKGLTKGGKIRYVNDIHLHERIRTQGKALKIEDVVEIWHNDAEEIKNKLFLRDRK